jgi:tetratricopeptide (TPR) repeat protein
MLKPLLERRRTAAQSKQERVDAVLREIRRNIGEARFAAAFDLAERLLDLKPSAATYETLLRLVDYDGEALKLYALLERLESDTGSSHRPWRMLLRSVLLEWLGWREEACAIAARFEDLPPRYGWMRYNRATMLMNRGDYEEARTELGVVLRAAPQFWKAAAILAECVLCQGDESEAFAVMDDCVARLRAAPDLVDDAEAATSWRGELRLWVGQYSEARADFSSAEANDVSFALAWAGATHLLLGDPHRALALLDKAVRLAPSDLEAYIWRGETHERLGRWDGAMADFEHAVAMTGMSLWPLVGRSLVRAHTGDGAGALSDFKALPARITSFFEWESGTRVRDDPREVVEVLRKMREAARGLRRAEVYLHPLWIRRDRRRWEP